MNFNIAIIAGYDVLADKIPTHIDYVLDSIARSVEMGADLIIFVGGTTNPDYPNKTEAEANSNILEEADIYELWRIEERPEVRSVVAIVETAKKRNQERADKFWNSAENEETIMPIKMLPVGNTSAETLEAAKRFIEESKIPVERLILCAEQSRLAGFLVDALMVGLLDLSDSIGAYGHGFPESKDGFESQRRKMLLKILSHRSKIFRFARGVYQKIHQYRVARIKRKEN